MESLGTQGRRRWKSRRPERDWWESGENPYKYRRGSDRTAAVRGLVIYPLNALVRDQIEVMRGLLDSPAAESFYRGAIGDDRIYFGQYVGATPGAGSSVNDRDLAKAREFLRDAERQYRRAKETDIGDGGELWKSVENPFGSQALLRWDMQESWPDLLITNFTMLSIMMVRERKQVSLAVRAAG